MCSACRVSGSSSNYKSELTGPRSICSLSRSRVHRTAITREPLFLRPSVLSTAFPCFLCPATLRVPAALELRGFRERASRQANVYHVAEHVNAVSGSFRLLNPTYRSNNPAGRVISTERRTLVFHTELNNLVRATQNHASDKSCRAQSETSGNYILLALRGCYEVFQCILHVSTPT